MRDEKGQIILILILVMTVALAIGLSIVQKSLVDVSTASKVEQSSRAFSAAEAGVEKALRESTTTSHTLPSFTDNSSQVTAINDFGSMPALPKSGFRQDALEYPPLAKEDVAQVWLADFTSTKSPPDGYYIQSTLDVYWGNSSQDKAALELTLVYYGVDPADPIDGITYKYRSRKWYLDQQLRTPTNNFEVVLTCAGGYIPAGGTTVYQCKRTLGASPDTLTLPAVLMLLRARLLYNSTSQPLAVQSSVICPTGPTSCTSYSLPTQARTIISTGVSGETQRRVQVFQQYKMVPPYFDYAIFSAGEINK